MIRYPVAILALVLALLSQAVQGDVPYQDGPLVENPGMGDRGYRHGEHHHQYMHWHNQLGIHCCNSYDCRMTVAKWENGGWTALVDGVWVKIDADRHVQDDLGVGPFASVCASRTGHVWCFDAPDPSM
jgi:hypothetical protein